MSPGCACSEIGSAWSSLEPALSPDNIQKILKTELKLRDSRAYLHRRRKVREERVCIQQEECRLVLEAGSCSSEIFPMESVIECSHRR